MTIQERIDQAVQDVRRLVQKRFSDLPEIEYCRAAMDVLDIAHELIDDKLTELEREEEDE